MEKCGSQELKKTLLKVVFGWDKADQFVKSLNSSGYLDKYKNDKDYKLIVSFLANSKNKTQKDLLDLINIIDRNY